MGERPRPTSPPDLTDSVHEPAHGLRSAWIPAAVRENRFGR